MSDFQISTRQEMTFSKVPVETEAERIVYFICMQIIQKSRTNKYF